MKHLKFFVFLCILTFTVSCGQQKKYIEYKVKEGETMRAIAKKLDMSTRDLLRLNPDISRKPAKNTVIIVPNKKMISDNVDDKKLKNTTDKNAILKDKQQLKDSLKTTVLSEKELQRNLLIAELEKEYKIHEVKKGDTFYSLTRFYNVSREQITELNPELSEGLKLGQIIKIMPVEDVFEEEEFLYTDEIEENISIKAAILLPFRAQELDTLSSSEIFVNSKLANIVTDFYLGAELAIDSLRKQGVKIQLDVYDTDKNSTKIKEIVAENDLNKNDVIIGPLYSEEAQFLADKIKSPIIFPFYSKKQSGFTSQRIIKTAPNKNLFRQELLKYIDETFANGNIIIVGDGKGESNFNSQEVKKVLEKKDSIGTISLITAADGYIKKEKFTDVLKPNEKNIVVLTTDDNIIVASAINSLISLPEEVTVSVFTFDKNSVYNQVDNKKLAQIGFTCVTDEYSREDSFKVIEFNKNYLEKNGALPSYYATKGFDITYDILIRLASGKSLKSTLDEGISYRVESKFDYTNKLFQAPENRGLFIIKFNEDLTLTRIK